MSNVNAVLVDKAMPFSALMVMCGVLLHGPPAFSK
jgi:hypothetical protein